MLVVDEGITLWETVGCKGLPRIIIRYKVNLGDIESTKDQKNWEEEVHEKTFWISDHHQDFLFNKCHELSNKTSSVICGNTIIGQYFLSS